MERLTAARKRQTLAVTVPIAFADKWLLHRLESFGRIHPNCELLIDTSTALVDFASQPVDVGIRYGAGVWPGLVAVPFARDTFFPVCSPSLLEGDYPLLTQDNLGHHQLIHDTSMASTAAFRTWRDWYAMAGLPSEASTRGLQINDSAAAYRMAMSGNGVALGRTTLVENDLIEGRLVRPFGPEMDCSLAYYVVYRPQDAESPLIAAFRNWLIGEASNSPFVVSQ
jgi:LysR family glycine cleavage system transcriptional activator